MTKSAVAERRISGPRKKSKAAADAPVSQPAFWTFKKFAEHFSISESAVHKAVKAGTLIARDMPAVGAGQRISRRIPYSEVKRIEAGKPLPKRKAKSDSPRSPSKLQPMAAE